ncbi:unnamed protein product [Onchocerca ochengi]|uniref:Reverse transcriptase domain-containing protein n=1 Tax=Onchocerca ochengi TaxID=42157 RepID=A0A182E0R6_ONCOC|nr:unnamed protein product [Onchocerca ochengi]
MESEKCEKNEYGIGAVITCLDTVKFLSFFPVEENFELFFSMPTSTYACSNVTAQKQGVERRVREEVGRFGKELELDLSGAKCGTVPFLHDRSYRTVHEFPDV